MSDFTIDNSKNVMQEFKNNEMKIMQCSKIPQPDYVVEQLMSHFPGWGYVNFECHGGPDPLGGELMQYILDNPIEGLPDTPERINYFTEGANRADFFRYYWLYINGGGFIDSDCMVEDNILDDINNYDMVTAVNRLGGQGGTEFVPGVFNGLLFVKPRNECIKKALENMYYQKINESHIKNNWQVVTQDLYKIMKNDKKYTKKIYEERYIRYSGENGVRGAALVMDKNKLIATHYHDEKIIPRVSMRQSGGSTVRQERLSGVRILTPIESLQWVSKYFVRFDN